MLIDKAKNTPALSQSGDYTSSLAAAAAAAAPRLPEVPPAQAEQRWNPAMLCCLFLMVAFLHLRGCAVQLKVKYWDVASSEMEIEGVSDGSKIKTAL